MAIVEEKVKPERMLSRQTVARRAMREHWWQYRRSTPGLHAAIADLDRVLVTTQQSATHALRVPADGRSALATRLVVFSVRRRSPPSLLFSPACTRSGRGSSASIIEDDLRYTPSDCFETFPFPDGWDSEPALEAVGQRLLRVPRRADGRERRGAHEDLQPLPRPDERDPDIVAAARAARRDGPRGARRLRLG